MRESLTIEKDCRWLGIRRREVGSQTQYYWCGNFLERVGTYALTCSNCPAYEKKRGEE